MSLLSITDGTVKVKSTEGGTDWGGDGFDSRMVCHFVKMFGQMHKKKDLTTNGRAIG